mmetsp:Transcript_14107/g.19516  ORF Transcript_14107/g.19516 Transcript_14107/m.19516 type:complete len:119 (+) Transcript_14107:69-425(+)
MFFRVLFAVFCVFVCTTFANFVVDGSEGCFPARVNMTFGLCYAVAGFNGDKDGAQVFGSSRVSMAAWSFYADSACLTEDSSIQLSCDGFRHNLPHDVALSNVQDLANLCSLNEYVCSS